MWQPTPCPCQHRQPEQQLMRSTAPSPDRSPSNSVATHLVYTSMATHLVYTSMATHLVYTSLTWCTHHSPGVHITHLVYTSLTWCTHQWPHSAPSLGSKSQSCPGPTAASGQAHKVCLL